MVKLYKHQADALNRTKDFKNVAYYHDMGLGKTFTGSEKLARISNHANLIICQKSKVDDWVEHFQEYYVDKFTVYDLTDVKNDGLGQFIHASETGSKNTVGVINYELAFRRPELKKLNDLSFTLLLDESSMIQNPTAKRTKFIMSLKPKNVILLSGTPTGGKYERLITQMNLLGWRIKDETFWNRYVEWHWRDIEKSAVTWKVIDGYKNTERMKKKMRSYGCDFLKTKEVFYLPDKFDQRISINVTRDYTVFRRDSYLYLSDIEQEFIGDTVLNKMLYERQLCGAYNDDKCSAYYDLLCSTEDRFIVFYNFNNELEKIMDLTKKANRPTSIMNGHVKNLTCYDAFSNSVTLVQYQAGAMGLNLQKSCRMIYFTPPLSSELFEQSKKRIHRIGQERTCFYYYLVCKNSIEEKIYDTLSMRRDYTQKLFETDKR